mgnify:FL=1
MCLNYKTKKDDVVNVKIGLSYTSIENAKLNLETEAKDLTFNDENIRGIFEISLMIRKINNATLRYYFTYL